MATKRQTKERVQSSPSLFPELEGGAYGGSLNAAKKPRRRLSSSQVGKWTGKEETSREKRNRRLWASLYPTPKEI
jgi:hypothetical protein